MKRISLGLLFSAALIFGSCKNENQEAEEPMVEETEVVGEDNSTEREVENQEVVVTLESKSGSDVSGTVIFTEEDGEVKMRARISGLSEGTHAIHIHEKADCSAEDGSSAGGHWNPTFEDHGEWGDEEGFHRGDIGNFEVAADGTGTVEFSTDLWCIGCDDDTQNILGKAVIVHDGVDDYTSQPSGAAGTRVACGVIVLEE